MPLHNIYIPRRGFQEEFVSKLAGIIFQFCSTGTHTMTCHGWPDPQVLSQSFAINFRMSMIRSKVGWVPLPPRSPDSSTWLPQPGWRGATQKVWLFTWHFVLYLARGKRCFDLPGLGSFSGTRWWAICVRLWRTLRSVGLRRVRHVSHPYTQASPRAIYLPFRRAEGVCVNTEGDPYDLP